MQQAELTGPSGLVPAEAPEPQPGPDQVLIKVGAAGVSFPDLLMGYGQYQLKLPPPFVPGVEAAGTVVSAPEGSGVAEGDRVAATTGVGGWAEYALAAPVAVVKLPDEISIEAGAGLIMNYGTAEFALHRRGRLQAGETVLVHGAAGGTGTAAIQVAKAMQARVIAVVSSEVKAEVARKAGADDVLVGTEWLAAVKELTGGRGVDVVFDPVGSPVILDSLRALAPLGRHLVIGFAGGPIPEVKANRLLLRNVDLVGVGWGAFMAVEPDLFPRQWERLLPMMAAGTVAPLVPQTWPLEQAADALRALEGRAATGKVTLVL